MYHPNIYWLVVSTPIFPVYGKIKMFQTTNQYIYINICIYIYIYIIPNKLINNQQPLIINILIPIYWEYLQRTICIPICASHSLSLSLAVCQDCSVSHY